MAESITDKHDTPTRARGRRGGPGRLTPERCERFLTALRKGLTISDAAQSAGAHRASFYERRSADPKFRSAWEDALEEGTDVLEAEAFRRAVKGVERPIFQGGKQVGTVRERSDRLLEFLLKARRPAYRERATVEPVRPAGPSREEEEAAMAELCRKLDKMRERILAAEARSTNKDGSLPSGFAPWKVRKDASTS